MRELLEFTSTAARSFSGPTSWLSTHHSQLCSMFPQISSEYLLHRCQALAVSHEEQFTALVEELVEGQPTNSAGSDAPLTAASGDTLDIESTTVDGVSVFQLLHEQEKMEAATLECGCCYDDFPAEEMMPCEGQQQVHLYCNTCIRRYASEQIGQSKLVFNCLNFECKSHFSHQTLCNVLELSVFKNLVIKLQEEEITAANITDLECCPFCTFALIFDNTVPVNSAPTVFRCDNPECGKKSCRLCKKVDHSPAKCDERDDQKTARTRLEDEMTDAMLRECYKCHKKFVKHFGCNKMTCPCGATMCYLCNEPVKNYEHFNKGVCDLYTEDLDALHANEVQKRVDKVKSSMDVGLLLHDPSKDT